MEFSAPYGRYRRPSTARQKPRLKVSYMCCPPSCAEATGSWFIWRTRCQGAFGRTICADLLTGAMRAKTTSTRRMKGFLLVLAASAVSWEKTSSASSRTHSSKRIGCASRSGIAAKTGCSGRTKSSPHSSAKSQSWGVNDEAGNFVFHFWGFDPGQRVGHGRLDTRTVHDIELEFREPKSPLLACSSEAFHGVGARSWRNPSRTDGRRCTSREIF